MGYIMSAAEGVSYTTKGYDDYAAASGKADEYVTNIRVTGGAPVLISVNGTVDSNLAGKTWMFIRGKAQVLNSSIGKIDYVLNGAYFQIDPISSYNVTRGTDTAEIPFPVQKGKYYYSYSSSNYGAIIPQKYVEPDFGIDGYEIVDIPDVGDETTFMNLYRKGCDVTLTPVTKYINDEDRANYCTVELNANGGLIGGLESYIYQSKAKTAVLSTCPLVPEMEDSDFLGWYDNPDCTGEPATVISDGKLEEIPDGEIDHYVLYAKWGKGSGSANNSSDTGKTESDAGQTTGNKTATDKGSTSSDGSSSSKTSDNGQQLEAEKESKGAGGVVAAVVVIAVAGGGAAGYFFLKKKK